jgi:hypothetical protein
MFLILRTNGKITLAGSTNSTVDTTIRKCLWDTICQLWFMKLVVHSSLSNDKTDKGSLQSPAFLTEGIQGCYCMKLRPF